MATAEAHISLARTLPLQLQKFFAHNPPLFPGAAALSDTTAPATLSSTTPSPGASPRQNPFLPFKNPASGHWRPPLYSMRRQAELVKLARANGVEALLPYTPKKTAERAEMRDAQGLRVQGTGVGHRVKGHLWERTMKGRLDRRRQAMLEMPKMIQEWKERGRGKGWKKWPK